jgi:hypothetical protein
MSQPTEGMTFARPPYTGGPFSGAGPGAMQYISMLGYSVPASQAHAPLMYQVGARASIVT